MSDGVADYPVASPGAGEAVAAGDEPVYAVIWTAPPADDEPALTAEMLPAIRACVLAKRIWLAALTLAGWGLFSLLIWAGDPATGEELPPGRITQWVVTNLAGIFGLVMLVMAAYGLFKRSPRVLLTEAVLVGTAGLLNLAIGLRWGHGLALVGAFQLLWAYREYRRRMAVCAWQADLLAISPEDLDRTRQLLKAFCRCDEDFARGRIKAVVSDRDFLASSYSKGYRGQLLADQAILVSRMRDDCLVVERHGASELPYKRNMTKVQTEQGLKQFAFGPASVLAWKLWAGVRAEPQDIRHLARKKRATLAILRTFLAGDQGDVKLACLEAMRKMRRDPDVQEAARQLLGDSDPYVRSAAAGFLADAKSEGMSPHVLPLLRDQLVLVRLAAADYFRARPDTSAASALRQALQVETDAKAQKRLRKALDACEIEPANPYASQRGL